MTNTTKMKLTVAVMLTLILLMPLSSKAQDDAASGPANPAVADINDKPSDADQLSSVVDEIRSLRKLLGEIRGDVAVLREALEKRANVSNSAKKPLPYAIESMPDIQTTIRIPARQSVLLDEGKPIARIAVADPATVDVVQFTPEQIGLVGMKPGTTTVTVWFDDSRDPLIMLATVFEAPVEPVSIDVSNSPAQSQVHKSIEQALDEQAEINAIDQPLIDVIRQLRDGTGQNFAIDSPAIEEEGVTTNTKVNLQLRGVTLRSALKILLSEFRLTWIVENEVLKITSVTRAMGTLDVRAYRVGGLLMPGEDKEQQLERLIELVQSTIEPSSWDVAGGQGTIKAFLGGDSLVVRQHQNIHHRIGLLLPSMSRLVSRAATSIDDLKPSADGRTPQVHFHRSGAKEKNSERVNTMFITSSPSTILPRRGGASAIGSRRSTDGRPMRLGGVDSRGRAATPPPVSISEGRYVERPEAAPPQVGVVTLTKLYKPAPELIRVFSKEGSSRIDDLHELLNHIRAAINPDSWNLQDAKADVVFGDQIAIRHTPGTHDRISRLLKRMEAEAPVEDFKLQPAAIEKR